MPVDDFGNVADIIVASETNINRMNPSQLWRQWLGFVGNQVCQQAHQILKDTRSYQCAYDHIQKYVYMVNPEWSKLIDKTLSTVKDGVEKYVDSELQNGIMLVCPPFLKTIVPELAIRLQEEFDIQMSPVEFNIRDDAGNFIRRARTEKNIIIGPKYMYLLCKHPKTRSSGVSTINQFKLPTRPHTKSKHLSPIGMVPMRIGEDEIRQILACTDEITTARCLALYSNSHEGVEKTVDTILTAANPSAIESIDMNIDQLTETNKAVAVYRHFMSTFGVDSKNVQVTESDELNHMHFSPVDIEDN